MKLLFFPSLECAKRGWLCSDECHLGETSGEESDDKVIDFIGTIVF